jgi:hypothetical protein
MSRSMDMPRGKRFIMYHETLIKWRKFVQELRKYNNKTTLLLDYKNILKTIYYCFATNGHLLQINKLFKI